MTTPTDHSIPRERRRHEAVVDGLLDLAESQKLRPGDPFPTERRLAERFGVSRNVLRHAFGVLEERGIIRSVRGSGRYLRETPRSPDAEPTAGGTRGVVEVASIADVLEARELVEVHIAELACDRRTTAEAGELRATATALDDWGDNLAFHLAVAACTHNFALEHLVRQQIELSGSLHQRRHYRDPDQLDRMRADHEAIAAAIAARDRDLAADLVRRHLTRTRRLLLDPHPGVVSDAE